MPPKRSRRSGGAPPGRPSRPSSAQEATLATQEASLSLSLFGSSAKRSRLQEVPGDSTSIGGLEEDEGGSEDEFQETGREDVEDQDLFAIDTGLGEEGEAGSEDGEDGDERSREDTDEEEEDAAEADDTSDESDMDDHSVYESSTEKSKPPNLPPSDPSQQATSTRAISRRKPAWTDLSTSNLVVPLVGSKARAPHGSFAGTKRLRKLRKDSDEREVGGVEYERRLREMFEKLNPRPTWASLSLRPSPSSSSSTSTLPSTSLSILLSKDSGLLNLSRSTSTSGKSRSSSSRLPSGTLEVERLRNANEAQRRGEEGMDAAVEQVEFHPTARSDLLMVASRDRRVRLFQIDGTTNPLLQTLHIPSLPIKRATFHPSGTSALFSGPRPFLFSYDLQSGKVLRSSPWRGSNSHPTTMDEQEDKEKDLSDARFQKGAEGKLVAIGGKRGKVHLMAWDGRNGGSGGGSLIGSLRMNSAVAGLCWLSEEHGSDMAILGSSTSASFQREGFGAGNGGSKLTTLSKEGMVHLWDTRNLNCEVTRQDAGLFGAQGLELSNGGRGSLGGAWAAVGSQSGVVNLYDGGRLFDPSTSTSTSTPAPLEPTKSITNLITSTTLLRFSPDDQILALASRNKKDALKLLHLPSLTVFSNWPTSGTPLGHVTDVDFSRANGRSGYMVVGNSRGRVLLYALRHYLPSTA